jgi:acyl carrier protein
MADGNGELLEELLTKAAEVFARPVDELALDANMVELDADSLDVIELIRIFEDLYEITFEDRELAGIATLMDVYELLRAKVATPAA